MKAKDINALTVTAVVDRLGSAFFTRDVADAHEMQQEHAHLLIEFAYNALVGKCLKRLCDPHGQTLLRELEKATPRGSRWEKRAETATPRKPPVASLSTTDEPDVGPQCEADAAFTARMRLHQSWYRARVLCVPCGTGPRPKDVTRYGNMLRGEEAERGLNFLSPEIFQIARERLAERDGLVERFRLLHNMLSSQPMCFNLFGPLKLDLDFALDVVRRVVPEEIVAVERVCFEYAPKPASEYLADRTAFDAFIEFRRASGGLGFLGIETKLTEPFSQQDYDRPEYRRWCCGDRAPWRSECGDQLSHRRHNQLWRDHLLAVAMLCHSATPYTSGYFMLVRHPEDSECARTVAGYRKLLKTEDQSFIDRTVMDLVDLFEQVGAGEGMNQWIGALRERYLQFDRSNGARKGAAG